jgi:hypothetical protein
MESHPECVLTYHTWQNKFKFRKSGSVRTSSKLLTLMYRNVIGDFPKEFYKSPNGDSLLRFLHKMQDTSSFVEWISLGIRRVHDGGDEYLNRN